MPKKTDEQGTEYVEVLLPAQRQITKGHLAQAESDHFQATLNLAKAKAAKDEAQVEAWTAAQARAESDRQVCRDILDSLGPVVEEPDDGTGITNIPPSAPVPTRRTRTI